MTRLAKFLGRHDGTKGDINIYGLPAFVYGKAVEVTDEVADAITRDFGHWFEVTDKPATKAEKAPADPAKE